MEHPSDRRLSARSSMSSLSTTPMRYVPRETVTTGLKPLFYVRRFSASRVGQHERSDLDRWPLLSQPKVLFHRKHPITRVTIGFFPSVTYRG